MNAKTKAKIEAMADKFRLDVIEEFKGLPDNEHYALRKYIGFKEGAKPWAEWCERFEQILIDNSKYEFGNGNVHNEIEFMQEDFNKILKEYREWLDE